jgi:hypothetical protein
MLRKKLGNADKKTIRNNIQTNGFERLPKWRLRTTEINNEMF